MIDEDKEREMFEANFKASIDAGATRKALARDGDFPDQYFISDIQNQWAGWLAAKRDAAKEIETLKARVDELESQAGEINDALGILDLCCVVPLFEATRRDAERYRFVRMNRLWLIANLPMIAAPEFDEAIDAAMNKAEEGS